MKIIEDKEITLCVGKNSGLFNESMLISDIEETKLEIITQLKTKFSRIYSIYDKIEVNDVWVVKEFILKVQLKLTISKRENK